MAKQEIEANLGIIIHQIRRDHPTMSLRAMYYKINPHNLGRDAFEQLAKGLGYKTELRRRPSRTTDSSGVVRFENYLNGLTLTGVNQAFSSDITYFEVNDVFYYLTFVIDCYSRKVLGHSVSETLHTQYTTLPALKQAIKLRGKEFPKGVIFHSDGGGQYYAKCFLELTKKHEMKNSMCEMAYENGKAERLNGIIKNNYLKHWQINSLKELIKSVDRAVALYNQGKPHKKLNYKTPEQFEIEILNLQKRTKPMMTKSFDA
jgi:transposase InsO family protein